MSLPARSELDDPWEKHQAEWRDPAQIASQWREAYETERDLLTFRVRGAWWEILAAQEITVLVTREYEHLILALTAGRQRPEVSFLRMPHPSGLAVDRRLGTIHVASTRNPNQVYDLKPVTGIIARRDIERMDGDLVGARPLVPIRSRFFPGCLYMHDLAFVGDALYASAVGQNAIIRLRDDGRYDQAWWPHCIENRAGPRFEKNYIQLNSIAAGQDIAHSYFSASSDRISARRPGHENYPVDGRGVIFSGRTRDVIARGLTRPHSARLYRGRLWVDNSGYGELGVIDGGGWTVVTRFKGWTRGLTFHRGIAYVGTSRVIPRFRQYAPGLELDRSECGIHAVDVQSGQVLGSVVWPSGNQVFAVEWVPRRLTCGFPFTAGGKRPTARERTLFYAFATATTRARSRR